MEMSVSSVLLLLLLLLLICGSIGYEKDGLELICAEER
jgi:hypothetical protein